MHASDVGCLIAHAIRFGRLQHTTNLLIGSCPPPSVADIRAAAVKSNDQPICFVIDACAPMAAEVVLIMREVLAKYIDIYPARAAAVRTAALHKTAEADAAGIHYNGKLIIATPEPHVVLHMAVLQRALDWLPAQNGRIDALAAAIVEDDGVLAALTPYVDLAAVRARLLA
jgi:hypothetical protein